MECVEVDEPDVLVFHSLSLSHAPSTAERAGPSYVFPTVLSRFVRGGFAFIDRLFCDLPSPRGTPVSLSPSGFLFSQFWKCFKVQKPNATSMLALIEDKQEDTSTVGMGGPVSLIEFYINGFMTEIKAMCVRGLDLCFVKPQALTHHLGECTVNGVFMCR